MKKALSLSCLHPKHQKMANNPLYGIKTIQNDFHCSGFNEDYALIGSDTYEDIHQRCSSKSSGSSSVDTYTLKVRMENLEMALTMLRTNFHRMEKALNNQIEKTIEYITKEEDNEPDLLSGKRCLLKSENSKLVKAVSFLTESSKIMRGALAEHSQVINRLADAIEQPLEFLQIPNKKQTESPLEKNINMHKDDIVRVLCPKPVNPLNISERLMVENDAPDYQMVPTSFNCESKKTQNCSDRLRNCSPETNTTKSNNIYETSNSVCKCGTKYVYSNDADGEYVTLIQDYIIKYNDAFDWYNKPPEIESCSNESSPSIDECRGTLV